MSEITKHEPNTMELSPDVISSLVINGDLSKMSQPQKVAYYNHLCGRLGLDPATQPFKLLKLNGKEVMYADKGAAQQLSKVYGISHEIVQRETIQDVYAVTVRAKMNNGRYTDEMGAVTIANLRGESLANAMMKATTKAKRRAVLALLGLGMLDESEIETIKGAVPAGPVDAPSQDKEPKSAEFSKPKALPAPAPKTSAPKAPAKKAEDLKALEPKPEPDPEEAEVVSQPPLTPAPTPAEEETTDNDLPPVGADGPGDAQEPEWCDTPGHIGVIVDVRKNAAKGTFIILMDNDTKYYTKDEALAVRARDLKDHKAHVTFEDKGAYKVAKEVLPVVKE